MTGIPSTRINYFIRDVARRNRPIFESYKHLCKLHPYRVIDYVDFEWKYYQYYHGCSDLNMERSPDSSNPITFKDLPVDVLEKVLAKSDLRECMTLRKVSRDLRDLVDSAPICTDIAFEFQRGIPRSRLVSQRSRFPYEDSFSKIKLKNWELEYRDSEGGKCKVAACRLDTKKTKIYWDDRNFKEAMISDASTFLKNQKLHHVGFSGKDRDVTEFLKSMNVRLNVRSVQCKDFELLRSIDQFLNPQKLEEIILDGHFPVDRVCTEITRNNASEDPKIPKLKIEYFSFDKYSDELCAKFLKLLELFDGRLRFGTISIGDDHKWMDIVLRYLNPEKKMDEISMSCDTFTMDQFNEISTVAKITTLDLWTPQREIGIEKLLQFKEVSADFEFTNENLIKIRDNLLNCPQLERCHLMDRSGLYDYDEYQMNRRIRRIMRQNPAYDVSSGRLWIPNSQDYFQIHYEKNIDLIIERKSKH